MDLENIFSIAGLLATLGWIVLVFMPFWKKRDQYLLGSIVVLLSAVYAWIIISNFDIGILTNFKTLEGVSKLFSNKVLLLAGWIHYLAFDLLAGIYIVRNAAKNAIQHWVIAPILLMTFLFGPFGFLLYFFIKGMKTKKIFADL